MHVDGWRIDEPGGIAIVRCESLLRVPGVRHAFSTRRAAGGEAFDLGSHDDRSGRTASNRRAFAAAAGLGGLEPTLLHQVHGAEILRLPEIASRRSPPQADGVVALRDDAVSRSPAVRWADCVPVLLAEERGRAVAAVHSGWRGTVAGVVERAVVRLEELGVDPGRLLAILGPAIGPCCYEVGGEVARAVSRAAGLRVEEEGADAASPRPLDLREAVRLQLERAGLRPTGIRTAPWCTACSPDLFFSHRRQEGAAGRQMACIGWGPS